MEVREEVRQLAGLLCEGEGLELVSVDLLPQGRRLVIRVLLDKPGGITVGDCARVSRKLADTLDMNQTVTGSYQLEVSSPGIDRPLPTLEAVARFAGQPAELTLHWPRDGQRHFEGVLLEPDSGRAGLRAEDGREHWFEWAEVRSARLAADPWAGTRKAEHRRDRRDEARRASGEGRG